MEKEEGASKGGGWRESRRRRLTDRQSGGERARLRGIPGRARAVPLEARRFQSFARDDEPQTTRTQNSVVVSRVRRIGRRKGAVIARGRKPRPPR